MPNAANGTMVALSTVNSEALSLTDGGQAAGWYSGPDHLQQPVVWDAAGAHPLPLLWPERWNQTADGGVARDSNNSGYTVGTLRFAETWYDAEWGEWVIHVEDAVMWDSVNGARRISSMIGYPVNPPRAVNASGQIIDGEYLLNPSPLPATPSGLGIYPFVEEGRVSLYWGHASGAASYSIKRAAVSGGPYTTLASGVTGTSYTDTAVSNGQRYYYVVSALNAYGESANSNQVTGAPLAPPAPPTELAGEPGDGQVALSWNASTGADIYYLYRSTSPGGPYVRFGHSYETAAIDYGEWDDYGVYPLDNGTPYYYVVTALNSSGESPYSNEATATPVAPAPPPAPTGLTATAGDRLVRLSWNASPGANHYNLWRSYTTGGPYSHHVVNTGGTQWTDSALEEFRTYYYVVTAGNTGGESPNSLEASGTPTGPPPPAAPTALSAAPGKKKGQVTLKWTQSATAGVTKNRVYRSTTAGGAYSQAGEIAAGRTFTDTGLTSGKTYYFVVTAVSSTGKESAFSNQASSKAR